MDIFISIIFTLFMFIGLWTVITKIISFIKLKKFMKGYKYEKN